MVKSKGEKLTGEMQNIGEIGEMTSGVWVLQKAGGKAKTKAKAKVKVKAKSKPSQTKPN